MQAAEAAGRPDAGVRIIPGQTFSIVRHAADDSRLGGPVCLKS